MSAKSKVLTLGLILGLAVLLQLPALFEPWGADQAGYGYVAKGILEGKVPYKDLYDLTAYGVFFTFALFFKLFGMTMVAAHIGHVLAMLAAVALVYLLTDRLYGRTPAVIAALVYAVFSSGLAFSGFGYENKSAWGTYWYLAQREVFMAPLLAASIYVTIITEKKRRTALDVLNGLLLGLAAFYKLTAVVLLVLVLAFILSRALSPAQPSRLKTAVVRSFAVLLGFVLVQLPFLYYFWVHNALQPMVQALFVHLPIYVTLSRGLRVEAFFSGNFSIWSENLALWLVAAAAGLEMAFRSRTRENALVVLWALGSLVMVWGQGKFFGYHFLVLMPPLAALTGYGLTRFLGGGGGLKGFVSRTVTDMTRTVIAVTLAGTIAAWAISSYDYFRRPILLALGRMTRAEYYSVFNEWPTHPYSFRSDEQIVRYLRDRGREGDALGVVFSAGDTVIHFLTGMKPVTRFIQSWYLFSSSEVLARNEITTALRKEFIEDLLAAAPRFILCVHMPLEDLAALPGVRGDPEVKKLEAFLRGRYVMSEFPDRRYLFERIDSPGIPKP